MGIQIRRLTIGPEALGEEDLIHLTDHSTNSPNSTTHSLKDDSIDVRGTKIRKSIPLYLFVLPKAVFRAKQVTTAVVRSYVTGRSSFYQGVAVSLSVPRQVIDSSHSNKNGGSSANNNEIIHGTVFAQRAMLTRKQKSDIVTQEPPKT